MRALVHRNDAALVGLDVECVRGDVLDRDSLASAFEGAERVFHLAALISIDGDQGGAVPAINVRGARNVADVALAAGVRRLVHCSSVHAFDQEPVDEPLDETRSRSDRRRGHPPYDVSKAGGEREVRAAIEQGLDAVIVNPTGIIGPNDFQGSRMGRVILDLARNRLPTLIDGGFDWVDVRDVCAGILTAGDRGRTGESYLLGGRYASVGELAELVKRETGSRPPRLTTPMWLARRVELHGAAARADPARFARVVRGHRSAAVRNAHPRSGLSMPGPAGEEKGDSPHFARRRISATAVSVPRTS